MEVKEKAKELVEKFTHECEYNCQPSTVKGIAIKCALICVEEILKSVPMYTGGLNPMYKFYQEVKQELLNLK